MPIANFRFEKDTTTHLRVRGPRINVIANIHPAFVKPIQDAGGTLPTPVAGVALIDTGCSVTSIDDRTSTQLGLVPNGTATVGTAGGQRQVMTYPFSIVVPGFRPIHCAQGMGCDLSGQGIIVLIGMDILSQCLLIVNGPDGTFSVSV